MTVYPDGAPMSAALFTRALAISPGGVNSPVRAFRAVGGTPRFMSSGAGPYLFDADGRDYVDLVCSWGPMIVGHAHPEVVAAVQAAAAAGLSYGTPTAAEVDLAEAIVGRVRGVEQIRLVNSGTEATMSAIRLARGYTGRARIVKFAGCYHGHVDALLAAAGSGVVTLGLPDSVGVSPNQIRDTIVLPYNDVVALEKVFADHGAEIAAVITEAVPANMGVVPPDPLWGAELTRITREHGSLLVVDEVMTGFRLAGGGWLDHDPALQPDLVTYGKVMGGGLPAAAFGGRADVMAMLAPLGPVYQAGTLAGNPVAAAAGLATLGLLDAAAYAALDVASQHVQDLLTAALDAAGVEHIVSRAGSLFSVFFTGRPVRDYDDATGHDAWRYPAFFHAMLDQGVYLPPSSYEAWFVSTALDDSAIERIGAALPSAAAAAAAARPGEVDYR